VPGNANKATPARVSALEPGPAVQPQKLLTDIYTARASLALCRAGLEAVLDYEGGLQDKQVASDLRKAVPDCLVKQEELSRELEEVIFKLMKAQIQEKHVLERPALTESILARVRRRRELLDEALTAAIGDLRTLVSKETGLIRQVLPRLRDAMANTPAPKRVKESGTGLRVEEISLEEEKVDEVDEEASASGLVRQISTTLRSWCEKNVIRLEDALQGAQDALSDYQKALKGASEGRVAAVTETVKPTPQPIQPTRSEETSFLRSLGSGREGSSDLGFDIFEDYHGFDLFER
jgi:hypothetical protein